MLFKDIHSRRENNEPLYSWECLQEKEKRRLVNFQGEHFSINKGVVLYDSITYGDSEVNELCYNFRLQETDILRWVVLPIKYF